MEAEGELDREGSTKDSWYVVVSFQSGIEERAEHSGFDPRGFVTNAFYMTHHWKDDLERREGAWWIPYDTEEECRVAWQYVRGDRNFYMNRFLRVAIAKRDRKVTETLYILE
ncbi:hypothetical protein NCS52_01239500 [Fusarium sp. LHS14.1]|nr:hypothetical protein NCS52_01239500 [Fusarium sp. LHS14.1]